MSRTITVVGMLLLACATRLEPGEPVWGKEPCAHCSMLVSEKAPAAQVLLDQGQYKYFDDVGCLVLYLDSGGASPKASWVRSGEGWKRAEEARYAPAHTPMDFGFVGAAEGVPFDEVRRAVRAKVAARDEPAP